MSHGSGKMTAVEIRALGAPLTAKLVEALDFESLDLPKTIKAFIRPMISKTFSLTKYASLPSLVGGVGALSVYGETDRACRISEVLGEVPADRGLPDYEYYASSIHVSYYFAIRNNRFQLAEALEPLLTLKRGVNRNFLEGQTLKYPFHDEAARAELRAQGYADKSFVMALIIEIVTLSSMWVRGGSEIWPVPRIDQQIDLCLDEIDTYEGYVTPRRRS